MQKIVTFLSYENRAEEAVNFYCSIFKSSKVDYMSRYPEGGPGPVGQMMVAGFELEGQKFMAMNGGSYFKFEQGISLLVNCETQEEVDDLWERLSEGGEPIQCGWLKDKFGVSWQIIPTILGELLNDPDAERSGRVLQAMMQMQKIDIAGLRTAYAGD